MPSPKKVILSNALLVFFGICIALVITEPFFKSFNLRPFKNISTAHRIYHHALVPNATSWETGSTYDEYKVFHSVNRWGFRGRFCQKDKPEDTFRILMLGDSFTQGLGVEMDETFSDQLEKLINRSAIKKKVEVLNMGLISYSPTIEYMVFKNLGINFNPDIVILNFDLSDIQDEFKYSRCRIMNKKGELIAVRPHEFSDLGVVLFGIDQTLIKKSVAYCYLRIPFQKLSDRINGWCKKIKRWYHKKILKDWQKKDWITIGDIKTDRFAMTRDVPLLGAEPYWQMTFDAIKNINDLAKSHNIKFILTVYPYGHQVSAREWDRGRVDWHLEQDRVYTSSYPFDRLDLFARNNNIMFLSLKEAFIESKEYPLYFDFDGHFTPKGHRVYAEALYNFLLRNRLIPMF